MGELTEWALASGSWLVLAGFMIYDLAHFMLPAESRSRSRSIQAGFTR